MLYSRITEVQVSEIHLIHFHHKLRYITVQNSSVCIFENAWFHNDSADSDGGTWKHNTYNLNQMYNMKNTCVESTTEGISFLFPWIILNNCGLCLIIAMYSSFHLSSKLQVGDCSSFKMSSLIKCHTSPCMYCTRSWIFKNTMRKLVS